jgi:hypothetical protein
LKQEQASEETNRLLRTLTECLQTQQVQQALVTTSVKRLEDREGTKADVLEKGFSSATLVPNLFFRHDLSQSLHHRPADGGPSIEEQIGQGGDANVLLRQHFKEYFGDGPFMGDPIGTVLKHASLTLTTSTVTGDESALGAVLSALGRQTQMQEDRNVKLLAMGFPGTPTQEKSMLKFFESEQTARAFLNLWNSHLDKLIADVDPSQQDGDAFHASSSAGASDESRKTRRLQFFSMLQASIAAMINVALSTIQAPTPNAAVARLVTSEQGCYAECKVMARLRLMFGELYRLRRVHAHSYEFASLAVLARLRSWQTDS